MAAALAASSSAALLSARRQSRRSAPSLQQLFFDGQQQISEPMRSRHQNIFACKRGSPLCWRRRGAVAARAAAIAEAPTKVFERQYKLNAKHELKVEVEMEGDVQLVRFVAQYPGKLLLHWGVEGGDGYNGGWRLPGEAFWPTGTRSYKNRALQTSMQDGGGSQELVLRFSGAERSDWINFVLKDGDSWYDNKGSNYHVPLHAEAGITAVAVLAPEPPTELCGVWAYIKWESDGCPNRPGQEADAEYQLAIKDIKGYLNEGVTLEQLWNVANGEIKYADFLSQRQNNVAPAPPERQEAAHAQEAAPLPHITDEMVGLKAYLLWESNGRPQGGDFSSQARKEMEAELRAGSTLAELEARLVTPGVKEKTEEVRQQPEAAPPPAAVVPAEAAPAEELADSPPEMGISSGVPQRNPMDLLKVPAPLLSMEAYEESPMPLDDLRDAAGRSEKCVWNRTYELGSKAEMLVSVWKLEGKDGPTTVQLTTDLSADMVLHWGVKQSGKGDWLAPPPEIVPSGSTTISDGNVAAVDTTFETCSEEECTVSMEDDRIQLQRIIIQIPAKLDISGLTFVLRSQDSSAWWKDGGSNFKVPVPREGRVLAKGGAAASDPLSRAIIGLEDASAVTLMHRFNRASDLLADVMRGAMVEDGDQALAICKLYVWLRYSASRQLTWQRNYNTQPRHLGDAQARLTHAIADAHGRTSGTAQEWVRAMLGTVGRGGNAQAVRDEILNIMHRHHIKEVGGTWMEQWHQKLHNNTTPDDIGICEAYIAFLQSDGDNGVYWRVLSENGITRERLESLDRKITCEPENYPDKRDGLVADFQKYLAIIKAVHEGADLQASAKEAKGHLPGAAKGYLGYVMSHRSDARILPLIENAVECRTEIHKAMRGNRELLYLDLALEAVVRGAAERGAAASGFGAAALIAPLLQNLCLSAGDNEEAVYCLSSWQRLPEGVRCGVYPNKEDALKAAAVIDRIRRAISSMGDAISAQLEPTATSLGKAFGVADWAISLFSEEVVRSGPAFALSLVLSSVEPVLRSAAELGAWQIISPVCAAGRVVEVQGLHEVQDMVYDEPTLLLCYRVTGEEEVPEGVVGVLTPDAPDVLSHLSVRARNMKALFAICHDPAALAELAALAGKLVAIDVTAAGSVEWHEQDTTELAASSEAAAGKAPKRKIEVEVPRWCGQWVVGMDHFREGIVGAKSKNIAGLRGRLPKSIALPASVTVPFGSFEEVLQAPTNKAAAAALKEALALIPATGAEPALAKCREVVMQVEVPVALQDDLRAAMVAAGIPVPSSDSRWQAALTAVKGVWASMYNERAMLSMKKVGIDFRDIRMAVLCQQVVQAQYAFVIHTVNPSNGDEEEIYAELVAGLGESIVSGMVPGASLAFVGNKADLDNPRVLAYPSKSDGMFVAESLIFRSDSNGEDLAGYAGAGLYDSITMDPTVTRKVDYGADKIVLDEGFRKTLLSAVLKAGLEIEKALGSAQDIEGVIDADGKLTVVQTRPQM